MAISEQCSTQLLCWNQHTSLSAINTCTSTSSLNQTHFLCIKKKNVFPFNILTVCSRNNSSPSQKRMLILVICNNNSKTKIKTENLMSRIALKSNASCSCLKYIHYSHCSNLYTLHANITLAYKHQNLARN